jgi:hypothetical protein
MYQPRTGQAVSRAQLHNVSADAVSGRSTNSEAQMDAARRTKHLDEIATSEAVAMSQLVGQPFWSGAVNLTEKLVQKCLNIPWCLCRKPLDEEHGARIWLTPA